jgi:hypothetical protein
MSESLRDILVGLWKRPTERDLQRLVGPSNISNPCSRCLAEDMLQHEQPESQYTMGAKIGTAIHEALEKEALKRPDLTPETKVTIAEVEGYGIIKGTSDLYIEKLKTVADHKTSTIKKVEVYRTLKQLDRINNVPEFEPESHTVGRKTIKRYKLQADIYGLGVENRGDEVKTVALNFIPRDAKTYDDLYVMEFDYDREAALRAIERVRRLWSALQEGRDPSTIKSDPDCFVCNVLRKV